MSFPRDVARAVPTENCGISRCEEGWSWRPRLDDHDLWFVVRGRGEAHYAGQRYELHPGSLLWLRPGTTGTFTQDPVHRLTVVACHFDLLDHFGQLWLGDLAQLPGPYTEITEIAALTTVLHRLVRAAHVGSAWSRLESEGLLLQALAMIYRAQARQAGEVEIDPRLAEAVELIQMDPASRPTLTELAAQVDLTPRRLSQLFRTQMGCSFRDFVVETRLQRAHTLLKESAMTVTEVAIALGYPDHVLLSRQFRARFGQPPSAARHSVHVGDNQDMASH